MARRSKSKVTTALVLREETTDEDNKLNGVKLEANITLFETDIDIKPMEGKEIGYRAAEGDDGIVITKEVLKTSGAIPSGGTMDSLIPNSTAIKTFIYNYEARNIELAVLAKFKPGKLTEDDLNAIKLRYTDKAGNVGTDYIDYLKKQCDLRDLIYTDTTTEQELETMLTNYDGDDSFILNRYPRIFSVNSVFLYVGPKEEDVPTP